ENAANITKLWRFPSFATLFQFGNKKIEIKLAFFDVDGDGVAVFYESKQTANIGFRHDVADDEAMATAGEAAVGDECDIFAKTLAHYNENRRKHFAHAGPAARSFESNDDDVAFDDGAIEDFFQGSFFGVEDAGFAGEAKAFFAGDFGDCAFG